MTYKVAFVSLGCAKNLVNTEQMMALCRQAVQNHYQRILSQAGLRYLNFHAIRHTFATRCITNGMDPKTLSEILGHSDLKVTLEYYFHSSLEFKKEQIDRLTALSPAVHTSLPDMPHNMTD